MKLPFGFDYLIRGRVAKPIFENGRQTQKEEEENEMWPIQSKTATPHRTTIWAIFLELKVEKIKLRKSTLLNHIRNSNS